MYDINLKIRNYINIGCHVSTLICIPNKAHTIVHVQFLGIIIRQSPLLIERASPIMLMGSCVTKPQNCHQLSAEQIFFVSNCTFLSHKIYYVLNDMPISVVINCFSTVPSFLDLIKLAEIKIN